MFKTRDRIWVWFRIWIWMETEMESRIRIGMKTMLIRNTDFIIITSEVSVPFVKPRTELPYETSAGLLEQSVGARNRIEISLSYRPAGLHIGWRNRFLGIYPWAP
jgi:hypothetical protein